MRGTRNLAAAITLSLSIGVVGCGVAADDTAATVGGRSVSIESVNDIARDPLFSQAGGADLVDYVLPGDMARSALSFEITRVAWISEAERWGLDLDAVRSDASSQLDSQLAQNPPEGGISESMREKFVDYYAAQIALSDRFGKIEATNESDLRRLYQGVPGLWNRTCAWIVSIPEGSDKSVRKLLADDVKLKDLPDRVKGATLAADPTQSCISDSSMPSELSGPIRNLPLKKVSDVLSLSSGGVTQHFIAEVESRETLSFSDAKSDLADIAGSLSTQGPQAWVQLIAGTAKINSRFGSGVEVGQSGPTITPPSAPVVPTAAAAAVQDLKAGQTGVDTTGSSTGQ